MEPRLEDAELIASPPVAADADDLARLLADPRVGQTLGGVRDRSASDALLSRWRSLWTERGYGPWMVRRAGDEFVGYAGIAPANAAPTEVELLYACRPELWGSGLTTRMARRSVDWAFSRHGFDSLVAYTMTTNTASRRVIEKTGFVYERDFEHASLPHAFYRLTRERWAARPHAETGGSN